MAPLGRGSYRVVIGKDVRMLGRLLPRRATDTVVQRLVALLTA